MSKTFIIHRTDNNNTRRSKKTIRSKIKRKNHKYLNPFSLESNNASKNQYRQSPITYTQDIESFCDDNRIDKWKPSNNTIKFQDEFCLFENPGRVLRTLLEMLHRAKTTNQITRLRYEGNVSFGALYLIDNLCWEIARKRKWQVICEKISDVEKDKLSRLRSIVSSTYESDSAYMINERVRITRSGEPKAFQSYKVKAKDITDLVQRAICECSFKPDFELPFEAYQAISSTIGEHFDNIILHAPNADYGMLCGFYDKEKKEITLLIYNFGLTIFQTLTTDSLPDQIKEEIIDVIKNHADKKFFEFKSKFTQENAITLLALQEGISSRVKYDKSRGHGLMDFIEHCFNLSDETRIVLISGNTAIKIDKRFKVENKMLFNRVRRVIAMNETNDIYERPSSSHVINLDVFFPGVIIETTIPLNF